MEIDNRQFLQIAMKAFAAGTRSAYKDGANALKRERAGERMSESLDFDYLADKILESVFCYAPSVGPEVSIKPDDLPIVLWELERLVTHDNLSIKPDSRHEHRTCDLCATTRCVNGSCSIGCGCLLFDPEDFWAFVQMAEFYEVSGFKANDAHVEFFREFATSLDLVIKTDSGWLAANPNMTDWGLFRHLFNVASRLQDSTSEERQ